MLVLATVLKVILLILVVLTIFNIIIFVHELGHFLAAKWRGLRIDRFQIWFGKPIWKMERNGVQYGLGWIPAGGFVALPQMAPMEALEGARKDEAPLPPITPMDKIIVAFAGPLFSLLLALLSAVIVWGIGKPKDFIDTNQIGYVEAGGTGEKAGLKVGDRILEINGKPVKGFAGSLDSVMENVVLSSGDKINFKVQREGVAEPVEISSAFDTEETAWFQRKGLRDVGINPARDAVVFDVMENSPAATAGLKAGDKIVAVDGNKLFSPEQLTVYLRGQNWKTARLEVVSGSGEKREIEITPERPLKPADQKEPMLGIFWLMNNEVDTRLVNVDPITQINDTVRMMWTTIQKVTDPKSSIGVGHLSGPVGIAKVQYQLLQTDDGWRRILAFMVLFNVNLAILNMMPFPVLDGGHITLAILEKIAGRPVKTKPLEVIQTACALALISLMLFVTSKDIGDSFGRGRAAREEVVFPDK